MAQCLIDWGEMAVSAIVLDKLDQISIATVGRLLNGIRPTERLPRAYPGRRSENRAQQAVPISVIHWDEPEPGYFEVDLVQHGAPGQGDKLIHTVQSIDVLTGWSERIAIMGTGFEAVWQAIQTFKGHCPIPVREIHSDNGSEFINLPLIAAFGQELVDATQTRGRPSHHNDNRFVEKNSSLVRAYVGYVHLDTYEQLRALNALYEKMWLYYNFFQPVLRQIERTAATGPDTIQLSRESGRSRSQRLRGSNTRRMPSRISRTLSVLSAPIFSSN